MQYNTAKSMQYFVVDQNSGQKYGPATLDTLNQWIEQGRLVRESVLEDAANGQRYMALQVPGLNFPASPPPGPSAPMGGYVPPQQGYQGYTRPDAYGGDDGSKDITLAYVFGALSFVCCPLVFGGLGIWKALEAKKKGHPGGQTALIVVIAIASISMIIGIIFNPFGKLFNS